MLSTGKTGNNYYHLYPYEEVKFLRLQATTLISLQNLDDFEKKAKSLKSDEARLVKW